MVEDRLKPGAPDLASVGVILANDVRPFEQAKLRLLNAAHSSLAYLGLLAGFETVGEAMADPALAGFVERLMRQDLAAGLTTPPKLELNAYIDAVLARFRNPALRHRLAQIAADGSQKLPLRLLGAICDTLAAGRPVERLAVPVAAWIGFVVRQARAGETLADPLAETLSALGRAAGDDPAASFLALEAVFPPALAGETRFRAAVIQAYASLAVGGMTEILAG